MLRKFSMFIFLLSSTMSIIPLFVDSHHFQYLVEFQDTGTSRLDWLQIFVVGLAVASLMGIFIFEEDSKKD